MHPAQLRVLPYARSAQAGTRREAMHLCWLWCLGAAAGPGRASRRRAERSSRRGRRAGGPRRGRRAGGSQRGLRDDAPSEARGADGERAGRRPPGTNTQTSKRTQAPRTASGSSGRGRRTGSSRHGLRDDAPSEARSADGERAGRRPRAPTRRTRAYNEAGTRRAKQRRGPRPRETVRPGGPP